MQTIGEESIIAVAMPVTMLVAPGPGGRHCDAYFTAGARVAVGHVRRALLVAHQDVMNRAVPQRVVRRQNRAAGISEDVLHAFALQTFPKNLCSSFRHDRFPFVLSPTCPPTVVGASQFCATLLAKKGAHATAKLIIHEKPSGRVTAPWRKRPLRGLS